MNSEILPADQRRAAELAEAFLRGEGEKAGDALAALVDLGPERMAAVTAVLARNLAVTLLTAYGREEALRVVESTRLDASVADE